MASRPTIALAPNKPLDLPLVVALAGSSKPILEQVVANQFGERPRALALANSANLRHSEEQLRRRIEYRSRRDRPLWNHLRRVEDIDAAE